MNDDAEAQDLSYGSDDNDDFDEDEDSMDDGDSDEEDERENYSQNSSDGIQSIFPVSEIV